MSGPRGRIPGPRERRRSRQVGRLIPKVTRSLQRRKRCWSATRIEHAAVKHQRNSLGGPNGIRTRVPTPPRAFASESGTCGVLSQRVSGGDGNPPAETKPRSQVSRHRRSTVGALGRRDGAAVDDVLRAGDGGGARRDEKGDEVGYFRRPGRAPDRNAAE